ncbi:MAG: response regulator [Spirochaetes bacterium]|nr:response regulator [Spirochaetota bacterium]MBU1079402.1 response regulator [Spirochaetota bacterium]
MAEPYKIILVDDEDEVRGRISSKVSAESGFVVAGTAGNGYDALELIEKHSPQVVLTDIKMPYIDGLELAGIIRRDYPTVRIGFITGFDEFDYAREAIELGVRSYLTKPLTQEDIASFLRKLKLELDDEIRDNYNREQIQKQYEQSIPLVIENCLVSLLASGASGDKGDIEQLRGYGVSLDESPYVAAYAVVERNPETWGIIEFEKLKLSVRARLDSLLNQEGLEHYGFMFHGGVVFIIKEKGSEFSRAIDSILTRTARGAEQFMEVRVSIGVSASHKDFRQLAKAYEEAASALSSGRFGALGPVSRFGQAGEREAGFVRLLEGDAKNLEHQLRYGSDEALAACIEELKAVATEESRKAGSLNPYAVSLAGLIANYAASLGLDIDELAGGDLIDSLARMRGLDQLFAWFKSVSSLIRQQGAAAKAGSSQRMLERAVAVMHRRFDDPGLTLDSLCEELAISPSYLSQLFRKYKESSFVKFLTGIRMERAIELLSTTGDRIVDIALQCGYKDVYYFSHSFKKWTGASPKKYREDRA